MGGLGGLGGRDCLRGKFDQVVRVDQNSFQNLYGLLRVNHQIYGKHSQKI